MITNAAITLDTTMLGPPFDHAKSPPKVSVIIPNFNGAPYVADSIRSACRQTLKDIEIIVSDDASTDESVQIIRKMMSHDSRIKLVLAECNAGPGAARNRALAAASGEWIAVLDADDFIHPERLQTLLGLAIKDGADIAADDLLAFETDNTRPPYALLHGRWARAPFWVDIVDYVRLNTLYGRGPHLGYLKPLFRSSLLTTLGISYDERLRIVQDYDLVLRLLWTGARFRVYPLLMYFYRRHSASNSYRLNQRALKTLQETNREFQNQLSDEHQGLAAAIEARARSIDVALVFDEILSRFKARNWRGAGAALLRNPRGIALLRLALVNRVRGVLDHLSARKERSFDGPQVCIISLQRVVGRTNGSSVYLLELAAALNKRGCGVHFLAPSPAMLGRWPYLRLSDDMSLFRTIRVRGTVRIGRYLISPSVRRLLQATFALLDKQLLNCGFTKCSIFSRPAPYPIAQPLTRLDQLFVARYAPGVADIIIADYCFLTFAFPYALRPGARTAVVMHDVFSRRYEQFERLGQIDSVASMTEDDEYARLDQADIVVAIQQDEAEFVRKRLPHRTVIVAPISFNPVPAPQPGRRDLVLFVGSLAAPNVDGLRWFIDRCWPEIVAHRPNSKLLVAGTVSQNFGRPAKGVEFLGYVNDLEPLYAAAGVVVSPLRVGSGLKIKLIEALSHGKAVVATPATLQGVHHLLSNALRIEDDPVLFAAATVALLDEEETRVRLGAAALSIIGAHFSAKACYQTFAREVVGDQYSP